jgi:hypothetical protein
VTGFRALLLIIALCYIGAVAARAREAQVGQELGAGT